MRIVFFLFLCFLCRNPGLLVVVMAVSSSSVGLTSVRVVKAGSNSVETVLKVVGVDAGVVGLVKMSSEVEMVVCELESVVAALDVTSSSQLGGTPEAYKGN